MMSYLQFLEVKSVFYCATFEDYGAAHPIYGRTRSKWTFSLFDSNVHKTAEGRLETDFYHQPHTKRFGHSNSHEIEIEFHQISICSLKIPMFRKVTGKLNITDLKNNDSQGAFTNERC
jgi:hypothetical protein